MSESRWWVGTTGCTAFTEHGVRVTITGIDRRGSRVVGAFAKADEDERMFYAVLDCPDRMHGVLVSSSEISRNDFDRLTGLAGLRRQMGWAA